MSNNKKIPIDIITGFSSSGKTTLINQLLCNFYKNQTIVILENGSTKNVKINNNKLNSKSKVISLTGGCICCSLKGKFLECFHNTIQLMQPDSILLEPSGCTDLKELLDFLKKIPEIQIRMTLCTVNSKKFLNGSNLLGNIYKNQIVLSNIILLNRTNNIDSTVLEQIHQKLNNWNPNAVIYTENQFDFNTILEKNNSKPVHMRYCKRS